MGCAATLEKPGLLRRPSGMNPLATKAHSYSLIAFQAGIACSSATPAPTSPEYGAVTSHTGMPLK